LINRQLTTRAGNLNIIFLLPYVTYSVKQEGNL